jgi:hypothetical protein
LTDVPLSSHPTWVVSVTCTCVHRRLGRPIIAEAPPSAFCEFGVHQREPGEGLLSFGAALADGVLRVTSLQLTSCPVDALSAVLREEEITPD